MLRFRLRRTGQVLSSDLRSSLRKVVEGDRGERGLVAKPLKQTQDVKSDMEDLNVSLWLI